MLLLSGTEKATWNRLGEDAVLRKSGPDEFNGAVRPNLLPFFRFFVATRHAAADNGDLADAWLQAGTMEEGDGLFMNTFLLGFLKRQGNRLIMPAIPFQDPRPFVHFSTVPNMQTARENFIKHCRHSLPRIGHPLKIMDIGCGNGQLLASLLLGLREEGTIDDIGEILLVDPSPAMVELAQRTVGEHFPPSRIKTVNSRIQDLTAKLDTRYDIALSSLAYHHMPMERKQTHMRRLREWIDHFILFELDANNDTPEMGSPDLAVAVYQCYGRVIDFVLSHDAPIDVALASVDSFLMTEAVSFFIQPRGVRTDYHMLRTQWYELFTEQLGPEFTCLGNSTAYGDEYLDLFTIHFGHS